MLISLNALKQYVHIPDDLSREDLLALIGSRLVEIEDVTDLAPKYKGIYIVKVVSCEDIPDTHLHLCQIDTGGVSCSSCSAEHKDSARAARSVSAEHVGVTDDSKHNLVQVVCGAPNVHAGMLAVWVAPGAIVPQTYGNENFRLSVRKLRGYESNGMLAAVDELDLGTDHEGIAEIDPKIARPGDSLIDVFGLDDLIIDVENKSLTHRPDCFGLIGFARELAGILGQKFEEPNWIVTEEVWPNGSSEGPKTWASAPERPEGESIGPNLPSITISDPSLCPRYSCAIFDLPENTPSKYLTQDAVFLAKAGMRSIDPMVDLTNIIMLQTGQPLHAFDYDKFVKVGGAKTPKIIVRAAREGEELQLLDGKVVQCTTDDILITSNDIPVALAGAMGGKNTEIDASTKHIILESATFSLYNLRKTQMAHGIFSEAITRFTKGQPAAMTYPVLLETTSRLGLTPGKNVHLADTYPALDKSCKNVKTTGKDIDINQSCGIVISVSEINSLLGTSYDVDTIETTLTNVGFIVQQSRQAPTLTVCPPAWRTDIHIKEDVIEEVGRLLGFDNIPLTLPLKPFSGTDVPATWQMRQQLRSFLSGSLRMHELLTYSFVSASLLEKVGQDPEDSYEIVNSISPELQRFRQHIVPSLLDKVRENQRSGHPSFALYEQNQVTSRSLGLTEDGTPRMENHLGIVRTADFYSLKADILALIHKCLHLPLEYAEMGGVDSKHYPYLEPKRSAVIIYEGQTIGAFGELRPAVLRQFKLSNIVSAAEVKLDQLLSATPEYSHTSQISRFPFVERDLTLKVSVDSKFGRFLETISSALEGQGLIFRVTPASIYQPTAASATRNISFSMRFASPTHTLESDEISAIMDVAVKSLVSLGATVV